MNFLWPRRRTLQEIETTIAVRSGRLLHWLLATWVGVMWLGEFVGIVFGYWQNSAFLVGAIILAGVAILLLGRGLRYIFSNE
jgi:hypothetical protein